MQLLPARDAARSTRIFASAERALRGPLAGQPLLTVFGAKNDPFGFQRRWKELFPDATEHVVEGGHHFPMNDDPDLFARALRAFASGCTPATGPGTHIGDTHSGSTPGIASFTSFANGYQSSRSSAAHGFM